MSTKNLVIDSSVMVKWASSQDEEWLDQSGRVIDDWQAGKVVLYAPELAKYEVGNAVQKKLLALPASRAALTTIYASPVEFVPQDEENALRTMEIAQENGMRFYDAAFVSLSENLGADLVTANPKHQKKFPGVKVIELKDY